MAEAADGLVGRELGQRLAPGPQRVVARPSLRRGPGRGRPVQGELGEVGVAVHALLERQRDALVQPRAPRAGQRRAQRVGDERVHEREAARVLGRLGDERRAGRRLEHVEGGVGVDPADARKQVELEVAPDHRGRAQHALGVGAQPRHASADHLVDAVGQGQRRRGDAVRRGPAAVVVAADGAGLGQVADHLGQVERVAAGLLAQLAGQRRARAVERVTGRRLDQRDDLALAQALERDAVDGGLAAQVAEQLGQRMAAAQPGGAMDGEDEQRRRRAGHVQVAQELPAWAARPSAGRRARAAPARRAPPPRAGRGRRRRAGSARSRAGWPAAAGRRRGGPRAWGRGAPARRRGARRGGAAATPGRRRRGGRAPDATARRPGRPPPRSARRARSRRCAAPRSASCAASRVLPIPGSPETSASRRSPSRAAAQAPASRSRSGTRPTKPVRGTSRSAGGSVSSPGSGGSGSHSTRCAGRGPGSPLSSSGPTDGHGRPVGRGEQRHDLAGQDLPAAGRGAQAGRLDGGRPEPVALLAQRVADGHADAHGQRRLRGPVALLDALLHADRAGDRRADARERDHQPVAQALDLLAAGLFERLAQQREVRPPQPVGALAAQPGRQLGRAHEIGEQQGDGPALAHGLPSPDEGAHGPNVPHATCHGQTAPGSVAPRCRARPRRPAPRTRVAILGGGPAALTAAFELTATPELAARHDVTIYQPGWRLGGKCASGRNAEHHERIEEHGLHVWFGCYDNGFSLDPPLLRGARPRPGHRRAGHVARRVQAVRSGRRLGARRRRHVVAASR